MQEELDGLEENLLTLAKSTRTCSSCACRQLLSTSNRLRTEENVTGGRIGKVQDPAPTGKRLLNQFYLTRISAQPQSHVIVSSTFRTL